MPESVRTKKTPCRNRKSTICKNNWSLKKVLILQIKSTLYSAKNDTKVNMIYGSRLGAPGETLMNGLVCGFLNER